MKVVFDSDAAVGSQYSVEMESGALVPHVSLSVATGLIQGAGKSIRQAQMLIAQARLVAAARADAAAAAALKVQQ